MKSQRIIVGISGSSGAILGIRLLQSLQETDVETHLVVTAAARQTIQQETNWDLDEVKSLADFVYDPNQIGAALASGSFITQGMVIIPCSVKTLSAVANSFADNLLTRAADVTLKEGRPLILVVREAPIHRGHIRLLKLAARAGATIFPPVPAFYTFPNSVDSIVDNIVGRVLNRMGIRTAPFYQWKGLAESNRPASAEEVAGVLLYLPTMTLALIGKEGDPVAAAVHFATDLDKNLYFLSIQDSLDGMDLAEHPQAAVTIYPTVSEGRDVKGLEMRGQVERIVDATEREKACSLLQNKFASLKSKENLEQGDSLFVFRPGWIRVIDHSKGDGHMDEWKA